jgi:hypothetical protein
MVTIVQTDTNDFADAVERRPEAIDAVDNRKGLEIEPSQTSVQ